MFFVVAHSYGTCIFEAFKKKNIEHTILGGAPIFSFVGGDHDDGSYYDDGDGDDDDLRMESDSAGKE